ncbi:hypothetical protein B0H14DRAFT_3041492 [Mycena olivaceomarginata]|nr:hypothetical protein B0H14DRAFT_3041492 [Mycena olivaceomarginata]
MPPVSTSTGLLFRSPCRIPRTTWGWLLPWRGRAFSASHRFGSSSLPPPFPHCNSLLAASSPIHLRLPRCLLACSAPPHIHSACEHIAHTDFTLLPLVGQRPYPRIHVSLRNGVLARPPSTCLHNIHRHRFGLPFIWWTDIHRPIRFMYQCTFNILAYPSSLSTVISLDAFVLSTVVAGALGYPACFCFAKGTQRSSERKNCAQIPREIQIALSASATYALAPCLFLTRRRRWAYD